MRTTDWDRIVTSAPLNRDAAVARDASGVAYTPDIADDGAIRSDTPLPVRKPNKGTDLSGKRCNRLVVQGLYGPPVNSIATNLPVHRYRGETRQSRLEHLNGNADSEPGQRFPPQVHTRRKVSTLRAAPLARAVSVRARSLRSKHPRLIAPMGADRRAT